jgi:UDP-2,3-diacylglucosamine hydrolase
VSTLLVSDLHLHPSRPATLRCFLRFLAQQRGRAESLYILGDLFEAWIGDDDPEPAYAPVRSALRGCVAAGTPVFLMRGNRDFLISDRFREETRCTLIDDPTRLELHGISVLLTHGDALCTDDRDYQVMRARFRDPGWQQQVLGLPVAERLDLAREARELSDRSTRGKDESIMDVNEAEALRVIREHKVALLIHGHTHRAGAYPLRHGRTRATRIDLGDWYTTGNALLIDAWGWRRLQLSCTG